MRYLLPLLLLPIALNFVIKAAPFIIALMIWYLIVEARKAEEQAIWKDPDRW